ncbi:MAG: rhomboid family intramembrane serine protease [Thermodesulfobacteriota bacterium]
MILPIGDAPNVRGHVPWVTYLLIAANVAVFLLISMPLSEMRPARGPLLDEYLRVIARTVESRAELQQVLRSITAYDLFVFQHGFRPGSPSIEDLFFSMFLHAGFLHLFGNMLFLWIYGDNVEHRLGSLRYLLAYLGTGIAAVAFHVVSSPGSEVPMVGASGAISGVLGFYFLFFRRNRVRLLFLLPPFLMQVFEVPARLVLGMYLVFDNLLPYLLATREAGVAHGAHIGGFIAGLAVAWLVDRRQVEAQPEEFEAVRTPATIGESIAEAIDDEDFELAARSYFALPAAATRGLLTPGHALELAAWLRRHGHDDAALTVLRRVLRDYPIGPPAAAGSVAAGQILLEDEDQGAAAYQYFLDALDLAPDDPKIVGAARRGIATIEARQKRQIGTLHGR